jgi:hypothetical protein
MHVRVGDRFVHTRSRECSVWHVDRILRQPALPPHAMLINEMTGEGPKLVSVWALKNRNFFVPAEEA